MRVGTVITVRDGEGDLIRGLKRQSSVIMAVIFKEFKVRLRTSKFGILYFLAEPILLILLIATIRWLIRGKEAVDGLHVMIWIPLGVTVYLIFMHSLSKVPSAIRSNRGLLDFPQVKPIDPLIAVFTFEICLTAFGSVLAFVLIWWVIGVYPSLPQPLEAMGVLAALLVGCFGMALLLGVYGTFYENIPRTLRYLTRPLILISDVIFPISALPPNIRQYLAWNPLLQFVQHFRHYAAGQPMIPEADMVYACFLSALMLGIGFLAYYANRFRLVQTE